MAENKNALDELNKGCTIGIEAINSLMNKVDNHELKNTVHL